MPNSSFAACLSFLNRKAREVTLRAFHPAGLGLILRSLGFQPLPSLP